MRIYILLAVVACLTGCGTANTLVLKPNMSRDKFARAELIACKPNVDVPADVTNELESVIRKGLNEGGAFSPGPDLRILYTIISYNPGNRAARYLTGGIGDTGEGSIAVMVSYVDKDDRELAQTQVQGRIGSGFFGGSLDNAIAKVGEDIVRFTIERFSTK
jgi:hypothetical protein